MQASSSELSTDLIFWKKTWSRTFRVRRCETSVVKSSADEEKKISEFMGWAACFLRDLTRTVDDSLPVHFLLADCGQKLRRDGVLPVLTVAHLLLQRRGVRQQRQRRVYAPAEIKTCTETFLISTAALKTCYG